MSRSQQRPLGKGGGSLEGLGPDWGTIWVALEWNTIPSGAGQERVRVHTLEIFLSQRPPCLSLGFGLGGGGGTTLRAHFLGVTPPPNSAGGDQTNKGWFFFSLPPKGPTLPIKEIKVSPIVLRLPTTGTWKFKFQKISPQQNPFCAGVGLKGPDFPGRGRREGGGEGASERRGRGGGFFLHGPIPHPVTPVPGTRGGPGAVEGLPSPQVPG